MKQVGAWFCPVKRADWRGTPATVNCDMGTVNSEL